MSMRRLQSAGEESDDLAGPGRLKKAGASEEEVLWFLKAFIAQFQAESLPIEEIEKGLRRRGVSAEDSSKFLHSLRVKARKMGIASEELLAQLAGLEEKLATQRKKPRRGR